jgi:hypothetical protein
MLDYVSGVTRPSANGRMVPAASWWRSWLSWRTAPGGMMSSGRERYWLIHQATGTLRCATVATSEEASLANRRLAEAGSLFRYVVARLVGH